MITLDEVRTLGDVSVLALTVWAEARGDEVEGHIAVLSVIRNRVQLHPGRFGATYVDACLAPRQFSCWAPDGGAENHQAVMRLADAIERGEGIADPIFRQIQYLARGVIGGDVRSNVGPATHYVTQALYASAAAPVWVTRATVIARKGTQVFMAA